MMIRANPNNSNTHEYFVQIREIRVRQKIKTREMMIRANTNNPNAHEYFRADS